MPKKRKQAIPSAICERILRDSLTMKGHRVSRQACIRLAKVLELVAIEVGNSAWGLMAHTGRKTIKEMDVDVAYKMLLPKIIKIYERTNEANESDDDKPPD